MLPWKSLIKSFSIFLFICSLNVHSATPVVNKPADPKEAQILWQEGKSAFDKKNYKDAEQYLRKLVDQFPAHSNYLDSLMILGKTYLEQNQSDQAMVVLKDYSRSVSLKGTSDSFFQAKLWLGDAYLQKKSYNEAYLLAVELEKHKLAPVFEIQRLLLKASSLMGKQQDAYSSRVLDAAQKLLTKMGPNNGLEGPVSSVQLTLKLKNCRKFPSSGNLEEEQIIDQLNRRGTCLLEALLLYKQILNSQSNPHIVNSTQTISSAYKDYLKSCENPYDATIKPKGKRSNLENQKHVSELSVKLKDDFGRKLTHSLDLLVGWKEKHPDASELESHLKGLFK
jgi:tetratricopeptide (TPR) repeat protein